MDLEVSVEPCIPPVNTVPRNVQIERLHTIKGKEVGLRLVGHAGEIECLRVKRRDSQLSAETSTQPVNAVPYDGQIEGL